MADYKSIHANIDPELKERYLEVLAETGTKIQFDISKLIARRIQEHEQREEVQ